MPRLLTKIAPTYDEFSTASSTGISSGTILDMSGYEGVLFFGWVDVTATANRLIGKIGTATDAMDTATGAFVEFTATQAMLDLYRPPHRYVQANIRTSGASAKRKGVLALQYGARALPTSATAWVTKLVATPATGAATA